MRRSADVGLSVARLKAVLQYDPDSGLFWWIAKPHPRANNDIFDQPAGLIVTNGYRGIRIDGVRHSAHRLAWYWMTGEWPENDVDHINGDRDDNRWANLRKATRSENRANLQRPWRKQKYLKGVTSWGATTKFGMQVAFEGRRYTAGPFDTQEEAHAAYRRKAAELHGEFASFKVNLEEKPRLSASEEAEWEDVCALLTASWPSRAGASAGLMQ